MSPQCAWSQDSAAVAAQLEPQRDVLSDQQWQQLDQAVEKSLTWLAAQQAADGSFPTTNGGQPGVTALCVLSFAAHGHLPGQGPHGDRLQQAMTFIVSCQKQNGLLDFESPDTKQISRRVGRNNGNNAAYNHAISATVLSELYSLADGDQQLAAAIERAMNASLKMQRWPKAFEEGKGGWRYLHKPFDKFESDLSVTAWELMFLRSAANAGFDVPKERIDEGVAYVLRTFIPKQNTFSLFAPTAKSNKPFFPVSRAMAGAGSLALAHSGVHDRPETQQAADFLLKHPCVPYGQDDPFNEGGNWYADRYHYSAFLATQAMYQMGGEHWQQHFPGTVNALLANQRDNGSWPPEKHQYDARFGDAYTTALVVLTLGASNQLLPVFQR